MESSGCCFSLRCVMHDPEPDLFLKLAYRCSFKGCEAYKIAVAAGELGAKGCDWYDMAGQVLDKNARYRCLRGRDIFYELPCPDLLSELAGVSHNLALASAWKVALKWKDVGVSAKTAHRSRQMKAKRHDNECRSVISLA